MPDRSELFQVFRCSCTDGFTGDFCEFKTEQDNFLFVADTGQFIFNADGELIKEGPIFGEPLGVKASCSTVMNGEAIIVGDWKSGRQVDLMHKT